MTVEYQISIEKSIDEFGNWNIAILSNEKVIMIWHKTISNYGHEIFVQIFFD